MILAALGSGVWFGALALLVVICMIAFSPDPTPEGDTHDDD